jgi:predicted Zn-dependent protease
VRAWIAIATLLVAAAPVGAAVKPKAETRPAPPPAPYAGIYQPQGVDEVGLWREDDERERKLANSPLLIRDEALNAYVRGVFCSAVGADRCAAVRTYVLRVPVFNANMSPNGTMQIYSGLLLRARSEAELASVLGHEFAHFEKRHTLNKFKAHRSGTDLLSWSGLIASMAGTRAAAQNFNDLQLSVLGGLARYGRDQEREADLIGLGYLNQGTLRPGAASRVWRSMILEQEASAAARGLRKPDFDRVAFFASHPASGERADYLYSLAIPSGETREEGEGRYAAAMARWLPTFLDDQIKLNDFGGTDYIIGRLAESGWTATLWRARGDLFRGRGEQRDLMNATDFYTKAVALDPQMAEAQRGLGLALVKTGRVADGAAALRRYLDLRPDATDAAMIGMVLSSLGPSSSGQPSLIQASGERK